jgi:hypothetical protein
MKHLYLEIKADESACTKWFLFCVTIGVESFLSSMNYPSKCAKVKAFEPSGGKKRKYNGHLKRSL